MQPQLTTRKQSHAVHQRALQLGYTPLQAKILAGRLTDQEADTLDKRVSPKLSQLDGPETLPDIDQATNRIVQAIADQEMVLSNTDFDCDGVSGQCVIQSAMVDVFGHPRSRLKPFIGLRLRDGYGVSANVTERMLREIDGRGLCVTADQGTGDQARVALLKERGIDTVVTDHHGVPEEGPPASAVACVNPTRADSNFPDRLIAGVHVAFLVMASVRQRLIAQGMLDRDTPSLAHLSDFVALGVTADAVSFARSINNRAIVSYGLSLMNRDDARPAWKALRRHLKKDDAFTSTDIAFSLGPLVNAAGRMSDAMEGVRYLMSTTEQQASAHLQLLDQANRERREIEARMKERALVIADAEVQRSRAGLVIYMDDGHAGIHGVVASRVAEAFGRPVACFSPKPGAEGVITGSLRSIPGVHMRECLVEIQNQHPGCQLGFGGHEGAAGTHLLLSNLDRFAEAFDAAVKQRVGSRTLAPCIWVDGELPGPPDLSYLPQIAALQPYGREFDTPVFTMTATVESMRPVGDQTHLQVKLRDAAGGQHAGIWFRAIGSDGVPPVKVGERRQFAFELDANTFRNRTSVQLKIRGAAPRN